MAYKTSFSFDELGENLKALSSPEAKAAISQISFESLKNAFLDNVAHRLFCFDGATGRKEFGLYSIAAAAVYAVYVILIGILTTVICITVTAIAGIFGGIVVPILTGWAVPALLFAAIGVRRLHDTGKSGLLMLIGLVPLVGWFIVFALCLGKKAEGCCCGCGCEQK